MNYLIGHALNKNKGVRPAPEGDPYGSDSGVNYGECADFAYAHSLRETSLPWEILEAAHSLFQKRGFERTSVPDICRRLEIEHFEFYNHFSSLDEVLEILWAR